MGFVGVIISSSGNAMSVCVVFANSMHHGSHHALSKLQNQSTKCSAGS